MFVGISDNDSRCFSHIAGVFAQNWGYCRQFIADTPGAVYVGSHIYPPVRLVANESLRGTIGFGFKPWVSQCCVPKMQLETSCLAVDFLGKTL